MTRSEAATELATIVATSIRSSASSTLDNYRGTTDLRDSGFTLRPNGPRSAHAGPQRLEDSASMASWRISSYGLLPGTAIDYVRFKEERLLIYADTPWIQVVVVSLLTMPGFNVATVRSSDSHAVRDFKMDPWNKPKFKRQLFVTNSNTMATGVNMHACCWKGVFMCWHLNCVVMIQTIDEWDKGRAGAAATDRQTKHSTASRSSGSPKYAFTTDARHHRKRGILTTCARNDSR